MDRRKFITALGAAAVLPPAARAQEAGRIYRLGLLIPATRASIAPFFDELRINGFVEGQNLVVIGHYSVPAEQIADSVAAVMKAEPEVILSGPETYLRGLQTATRTIPLDSMSEDLVGEGFAASLAKPGGNVTGISLLSPELDGKRLEILIEAVPGLRRMAALAHSIVTKQHLEQQQELARSRGVQLSVFPFAKASDIVPALDEAKARGAQAINFLATPYQVISRDLILDHMSRISLPAIYQWPETPELGGLIGYGPPFAQMYRQRARQVAKMLRGGAKPTEVPVEQPSNFELVINLKTAKAIGLEIPAGLVLRADKVIE